MKKINTLFCALAILVLFVFVSGCNHSKKETETGEAADNDAVDADIDNKELPECSPTSETPCKDSSSGLVWSAKSLGNVMYQLAAYDYCDNLSEGGFSDWRLPLIDELRTLIENCRKTETGGECRASEECRDSRCENDACAGCPFNSSGYYSKLGDSETLWSYSWPTDGGADCSWSVNFSEGAVHIDNEYLYTRCVRGGSQDDEEGDGEDEEDEEDEEEEEEENGNRLNGACFKVDGREWSNLSSIKFIWSDAVKYCDKLNQCGHSDWHLPTISELRTLIQNNPGTESGGTCGVTDTCLSDEDCYDLDNCWSVGFYGDGPYSKLGDEEWFWSSSDLSDEPDYAWGVDFYDGTISEYEKNVYDSEGCNVRCVR